MSGHGPPEERLRKAQLFQKGGTEGQKLQKNQGHSFVDLSMPTLQSLASDPHSQPGLVGRSGVAEGTIFEQEPLETEGESMIPADQLEKLKQLFAQDGIALTDAAALEIALWLITRVRPVVEPIPLDKMAIFGKIRGETKSVRGAPPLVNLHQWRRNNVRNKKNNSNDVSP